MAMSKLDESRWAAVAGLCFGALVVSGCAGPSKEFDQGVSAVLKPQPAAGVSTPRSELEVKSGDDETPVRSVLLMRDPNAKDKLLFFRDDVDCKSLFVTPMGPDTAIFSAEVELGTDGLPALARPMKWHVNLPDDKGDLDARPEHLTITRVPNRERVEGRITVAGRVDDDLVRLEGPFVATVCEV